MFKVNGFKKNFIPFIFSLLTLSFLILPIQDIEAAEVIGKFSYVEGQVDVLREGRLPAKGGGVNDPVIEKDIIRTKSNSRAEVTFRDGNTLRIDQRSRIDVSEYLADEGKNKGVVRLARGKVEAVVEKSVVRRISVSPEANRFEIHTPNAVAGVRGTDFYVFFHNYITAVFFKTGVGYVFNPEFPSIVRFVPAGYMVFVIGNEIPKPARPIIDAGIQLLDELLRRGPKVEDPKDPEEISKAFNNLYQAQEPYQPFVLLVLLNVPETIKDTPATIPITEVIPPIVVPAVEVGRTNLSGALVAGQQNLNDYVSIFMRDVVFLAPSTGQRPSVWGTNSVSGHYSFGSSLNSSNITGTNNVIPLSNGHGLTADFQFTNWNTTNNQWNANVLNGSGNLSGGSYSGSVNFNGNASGTIGTSTISGTASGPVH